jgi:ring-1,2-phenylacetyl-CoA epoxidase subunit PaaD
LVTARTTVSFDELCVAIAQVPDPEVPVLTIEDLGILRGIENRDGTIIVTLTPTYSGCPAIQFIEDSVQAVMADAGYTDTEINTVFSPAWTTEWMSQEGKAKLKAFGIAPPQAVSHQGAGTVSFTSRRPVRCPQCDSADTRVVSEFGSTACKALYICNTCSEPFDYFKEL